MFIKKLLKAGVEDQLPGYLNRTIQLANAISLLNALVIAIPFTCISLIFFPSLVFIPVLGFLACSTIPILNYMGFTYVAKSVVAIVPCLLATIFHAYLLGSQESVMENILLIQIAFCIIPFLVFDLQEKLYLALTAGIVFFLLMGFDFLNQQLVSSYTSAPLRQPLLVTVTKAMAILLTFSFIIVMSVINRLAEAKSEELRKMVDQNYEAIKQSEVALKTNIQQLENAKVEEQQRNWIVNGVAQLGEILRKHQAGDKLYDEILAFIVTYTQSNQGGLYLVQASEGPKVIDLVACYAFNRKKFIQKRVEIGQGLVGQAYLEKEYIYLTQVPKDYIKITSGLGEANPRAVIVLPLVQNQSVEGILELASFTPYKPHQIEFFKQLSESLASALYHQQINVTTQKLYKELQSQTQQMQASEEELRQNQEELVATQEELQRQKKELEEQVKLLQAKL